MDSDAVSRATASVSEQQRGEQARTALLETYGADAMGMLPPWSVNGTGRGEMDVVWLSKLVEYAYQAGMASATQLDT